MTKQEREKSELKEYYELHEKIAELTARAKELRVKIDGWTGLEDTTRGLYTITYKDQTRTKTDTAALYEQYGITDDDIEPFRTRTKTRELKAITKA